MPDVNGLFTPDELDTLMNDLGLKQFKESVKGSPYGRRPKEVANYWFHELKQLQDYADLSAWVDDVLSGAARLSTGNSKTTPLMIFHLMRSLPFLSVQIIQAHLNSKRMALGSNLVTDERYCRWLISSCESVMKSLDFYTDKGRSIYRIKDSDEPTFNYSADMREWLKEKERLDSVPEQSLDELIEKLRLAGLTDGEIENHLRKRS